MSTKGGRQRAQLLSDWDLAGIGHLPEGAMAKVVAQIHASGSFLDVQITEIFDTATMDEARLAASYRPPGQ